MRQTQYILFCMILFGASYLSAQKEITQKDTLTKVTVEKLSKDINTPFDEIMPVLSNDGKQLFFTRVGADEYQRSLIFQGEDLFWKMSYSLYLKSLAKTYELISGIPISDPVHSKFNQDIWVADIQEDGTIGKVKNLPFPANSALPNSLCSATPNPNAYVVMNQFFPKGGMQGGFSVLRKKQDGSWVFPEPIDIEGFNATRQEINLSLSQNGTTLLLSMTRGDSKGSQDLYVSFLKPSGQWSYPVNLGYDINSSWKESSPFLASDNRTLFFSSNRTDIYGGSNLYSSIRLDDTWQHWSKPVLLVSPVNSNADDGQPFFDFDTGMLFFASNRDGKNDIYRVKIEHPTIELVTDEKEFVALEGHVVDQNGWLVSGAKIMYRPYNFLDYKEVAVAEDGTFSLRVPKGKKIHLIAKMDGYKGEAKHLFYRMDYMYFKAQFTTLHLKKDKDLAAVEHFDNGSKDSVTKIIKDQPIVREKAQKPTPAKASKKKKRKGRKIELKPIFFERSKDHILPKSFPELNRLVRLLKKYPSMRIRVEGHTDNNGKPKALIKLSKDRAVAIKAFLVNRGIDESRIETVGFGGQYPFVENDSERNRRRNRRVEVYVINKIKGLEFSELNQKHR